MKRDYSFEVFISIFIVTIIVAVIYGINRNNTDDSFYGAANTYNDYTDNCDDVNMLEPDDGYSPPVKGIVGNDSLDSLVFNKHVDLSGIDGDNFYSRDLNPNNSNITPRVNNYSSCNDEVEVKLPTKITIKPSIIQVFSDRVSYDVTYSY